VVDDLHAVGATHAWAREYAADSRLVAFLRERGFRSGEPYEYGNAQLVTLQKAL
jgi:hypothetical protein